MVYHRPTFRARLDLEPILEVETFCQVAQRILVAQEPIRNYPASALAAASARAMIVFATRATA